MTYHEDPDAWRSEVEAESKTDEREATRLAQIALDQHGNYNQRLKPWLKEQAERRARDADGTAAAHSADGQEAQVSGSRTINPGPAFRLIRASEMTFVDPEFAIEGLLEVEALAMIFGKPASGKSFVAIDMACCIATGTQYHGRDVKKGLVVYVAGEGQNGLKRRQMAWEKHHRISLADAPLYFSTRATSLMDAAAVDEVISEVDAASEAEGAAPRLVVIDTVARNFGAGDESKTPDMNAFVAGADSIKHKYPGCTVLLVHHSGHGDSERGRGSSVLLGALDAEYRVEIDIDTTTLTCTKMKEATKPAPISFKASTVQIGTSKKGEPVTSLALDEVDAPPKRPPKLKGQPLIAMQAFGDALAAHGQVMAGEAYPKNRQCISLDQWREACDRHSLSSGEGDSSKRTAFHKAKAALLEKGIIRILDGFVWRCDE
ncbi:AAA family ATPase [Cereibacter azotoformans]|uniref:AAA family ATPase n=1 Tax=Cereibacter azotoformans TaxID=43057 RepID=UPI0015D59A8D|nr:AAA family ATPase [Cereibacter azotoformans]